VHGDALSLLLHRLIINTYVQGALRIGEMRKRRKKKKGDYAQA
jgi:hypothetical protein